MIRYEQSTDDVRISLPERCHYGDIAVELPRATAEVGLSALCEAYVAFLVGLTFPLDMVEDHILEMADEIQQRRNSEPRP